MNIASGAVTVQKIKFYTEEQIKARMGLEKAWEAHNKHSKQLQEEETKIIADGRQRQRIFLRIVLREKSLLFRKTTTIRSKL